MMDAEEVQALRLGIQCYVSLGWAIVIQAPFISREDIQKVQDVIEKYLVEKKITGAPAPYAASSSPYSHEVVVYYLNDKPKNIVSFLNVLYDKILAVGFSNPDS